MMIKLNRFLMGTSMACVLLLVLCLAGGCSGEEVPTSSQTSAIVSDLDSQSTTDFSSPQQPASSPISSLFNMFMAPLRSTVRHAKKFLGNRYENVQEGVDQVRLQAFKVFMRVYNKTYPIDEIPRRMELFWQRRQLIQDSMRAFSEGRLPFVMHENPFIDWDEQELKALTGTQLPKSPDQLEEGEREALNNHALVSQRTAVDPFKVSKSSSLIQHQIIGDVANFNWEDDDDDDDDDDDYEEEGENFDDNKIRVRAVIPAQKDWRQSGCIAAPINQQDCGACYAIATMGALESQRCLSKTSAPILSPQQIVDCSTPRQGYQNFGCDGGWPTRALKYLDDVKVAARESKYPYKRRQGQCRLEEVRRVPGNTVHASASDSRLTYKLLYNERDILYHVGTTGPVITVLQATNRFLYYGSGIFDDPSCKRGRNDIDHAIVIVGYGRENNQDYWLIKNSWGPEWGINGYGKVRRGTNACSIGHWGWIILS